MKSNRVLALGAILLSFATAAFAQSDARKLAIFYIQGDETNLIRRTTGNDPSTSVGPYSETNQEILTALDRMGVPYDIYELADTTNWWKKLGEAGPLAANNPGVPDSVRFRRAGYFGCAMVLSSSPGNSDWAYKRFQDGRQRGSYLCSPLSGRWGIPTVCWSDGMENSAPYMNGAALVSIGSHDPAGVSYLREGFLSGTNAFLDTLDVPRALSWQVQTGQADSITILIRADSISLGAASAGGKMVAWKWKASTYYYPTGGAGKSWFTLLGLNTLFEHANYTPRRKLNLHWTFDHPYPESFTDTAPSESVWVYIDKYGWRWSGAVKASTTERLNQNAAMATYWRTKMNAANIGNYPHSHLTGVGNYFQSTSWNLSTFADTALKRQRWNWMEASITDTLKLKAATGYERTIGFPGDGVYYPDLYIFAQNRYTDIRSFASDSIGITAGSANQHVYSGPATTSSTFPKQPYPYIEATTGRTIWVHDLYTHPGGLSHQWSEIGGLLAQDIDGYAYNHISNVSKSILNDADFYWHPNENLQNSTAERPMQVLVRRMAYFLGRLRRIVTVEPHYLNKTPRRTSIARG